MDYLFLQTEPPDTASYHIPVYMTELRSVHDPYIIASALSHGTFNFSRPSVPLDELLISSYACWAFSGTVLIALIITIVMCFVRRRRKQGLKSPAESSNKVTSDYRKLPAYQAHAANHPHQTDHYPQY